MPVPKSNQRAVHKYIKNHYDKMEIRVKKGNKEIIKAHAEKKGESLNGFLNRAVNETLERDNEVGE
jgi:predicted HicB family RNase H-like nuclease